MDKFVIKKRKSARGSSTPSKKLATATPPDSADAVPLSPPLSTAASSPAASPAAAAAACSSSSTPATPAAASSSAPPEHSVSKESAVPGVVTDEDRSLGELLRVPFQSLKDEAAFQAWFGTTADVLINACTLLIAGKPHRLAEIEFYVYDAERHPDPFPHMADEQSRSALWYFHKHGKAFRGGSYKGLDVTCGAAKTQIGGVLIRSIEKLDGSGELVNGPSLCVDYILRLCAQDSVAALAAALEKEQELTCWRAGPLRLRRVPAAARRPLLASLRVGLQPTKPVDALLQLRMLFAPYRFLLADKRIAKGRQYVVAQLLRTRAADIASQAFVTPNKLGELRKAFESGVKAAGSPSDVARKYCGGKLESDLEFLRAFGEFFGAHEKKK